MLNFIIQYIARKRVERQWKQTCKEFDKHYSKDNSKDFI